MIIHFAFRNRLGNRPQIFSFGSDRDKMKASFLSLETIYGIKGMVSSNTCTNARKGPPWILQAPSLIPWNTCRVGADAPVFSNRCVYSVFTDIYNPEIINLHFYAFSGKYQGVWDVGRTYLCTSWIYYFSLIPTSKIPKNLRKIVPWSVHFWC